MKFLNPRRRALLAAASSLALMGFANPASANSSLVEISVVDRDTGQALQQYKHSGRDYVSGTPGSKYSIRVKNLTRTRVMAVLSVDGVNIISGQTADPSQVGYVLEPRRSYDIAGWRKSNTEIAAFEFSSLSQSYAAKTGRPSNVGVIGLAVFEERVSHPPIALPSPATGVDPRVSSRANAEASDISNASPPATRQSRAADSSESAGASVRRPGAEPASPTEKLGTGHGQREWAPSRRTEFVRATPSPISVLAIEYDSHQNLVARGVIPASTLSPKVPNPFPAQQFGYVADPRN